MDVIEAGYLFKTTQSIDQDMLFCIGLILKKNAQSFIVICTTSQLTPMDVCFFQQPTHQLHHCTIISILINVVQQL